ncbi:MAG: P-loop NTPase family protein [Bellilinea sp.]
MTLEKNGAQSRTLGGVELGTSDGETALAYPHADQVESERFQRNPAVSLQGCQRILILGRTGSGKTTLARELAAAIGVPHVELDALYFGPNFSTVPLPVLRERTSAAIAGERWVTDGNKRAVRDLVWPRADTIIWLDYPLVVSLWRLGKRALWRTSVLKVQATEAGEKAGLPKQLLSAAKGVLKALRSHRGQRRDYPRMFADPKNQHLAVVRLRSPRATRRWLARVIKGRTTPP